MDLDSGAQRAITDAPPASPPGLSTATHRGRRANNEDAFVVDAELGLYVVADGMGGAAGGEIASALVVDAMARTYRSMSDVDVSRALAAAIDAANRDVVARKEGPLAEMASTVVALAVHGHRATVAHVGDSRAYLLRDGKLQKLTHDHSVAAEMQRLKGGAAHAAWARYNHVLTRAVGIEDLCVPDITEVVILPGDTFLLCSDGVSDALSPDALVRALEAAGDTAQWVVDTALDAGARDNVTAVVVAVDRESDTEVISSERPIID